MKKIIQSLALTVAVFSNHLSAEIIEQQTAERKTALASYLEGDSDSKPLLLLHGFLQTHDFPTVSRLTSALNEAGYTTLSPTLTLGLNHRKKSLACEAIHTHNTAMDTAEIKQWIEWLYNKTGQKVTVIGHSAGTQTLLSYIASHGDELVEEIILISLSYFTEGPVNNETPEHAQKARAALAGGFDPLDNYGLSYCKLYPTRASDFISYYEWDPEKIVSLAETIKHKTSVIIGTGDQRISPDWRQQLKENEFKVVSIEGANHFFDQAHEFDLLDAMETILDN